MKKIISVISITVLFILLSFNVHRVSAADNQAFVYLTGLDISPWVGTGVYPLVVSGGIDISQMHYFYWNSNRLYCKSSENSSYGYMLYAVTEYGNSPLWNTYVQSILVPNSDLSSVTNPNSGHIVYIFTSQDRFEDSLPEDLRPQDPSWWNEMWDTLKEELGNPAFWFGQWFIDIIDNVFGGENDPTGPPRPPTSTHVQINNPTITPAPTPIPYTTVVIPKTDPVTGDTYYEENYYYINPSGTPIITSSPPTNPPSQNGPSNSTDYSPVGGDPYSIPQVSWLTNATIGDSNYDGILSISQGMDSIDEIGSDYVDGIGAVQDATGTLPTSWLLLIGIAAAIPLIAGIISRFLS